jgi:hypothetical protein
MTSTQAPVPDVVLDASLPQPIIKPTAPDAEGPTSTSKLVVPVGPPLRGPPSVVFTIGTPSDHNAQGQLAQDSSDACITEIQNHLKDNILPKEDEATERIHLAKRYVLVEGDLY